MNNKEYNKQTPICVDTEKMLQGMSFVFSGAIKMLEALGSSITINADTIRQALTVDLCPDAEKTDGQKKADDTTKAAEHGCSITETSIDTLPLETKVEKNTVIESENIITSVSIDDVTKVILRKIKQNKANEEKIGNLVSKFGVAKVKELSPDKYEAFLTDLSEI